MNNFSIARKKGGAIVWSKDQLRYICDEYHNGTTLSELGRRFNVSYATIRNALQKQGVKTLGNKHNYPRDSQYFKNIDNKEKAYWLGYLYADGCVHEKSNEISVNTTDQGHLEKFRAAIKATNHSIGSYVDKRWKNSSTIYYFTIRDEELRNSLVSLGCVPNKALVLTKIPNIPRDYVASFLRGYFDGDGSLHWLNGLKNFRISFTSGSKLFLEDIKKELNLNMSIGEYSKNCYTLQIAGRHQVPEILNYLYKDSTENTRLERKYQNYLKCLQWAHRH